MTQTETRPQTQTGLKIGDAISSLLRDGMPVRFKAYDGSVAGPPDADITLEVAVPPDLASYLQPGYPANIRPHVRIFDESGEREVPMPDVNGVIVIEKR